MRILFLCHGFNALCQRLHVELSARGHVVSVEFDINDAVTEEAVALFEPDLIIAPFLKRAIPERVWRSHCCMVVHPGPPGDAGPSALDRAILDGAGAWGVTVLQAEADMDAGPVWASRRFAMRAGSKSSIYRHEVTEAAVDAVLEALGKFEAGERPVPVEALGARRVWRPSLTQAERAIDWTVDDSATVLRKIASADGMPGIRHVLFGEPVFLHDAHPAADCPPGPAGTAVARRGPAVALATRDGAVWIGRLRRAEKGAIKLPATMVLAQACRSLPETGAGYEEIGYRAADGVGYLQFSFLNGAMGTEACRRLLERLRAALSGPERVIVLCGGRDHWSNGMDLNLIEAARSPAEESWANINAMDDLAQAVIEATDRLLISAVGGNAGAGGVFLARAADRVWLREGVILNPHYKDMGNLYGSEFWTYLLPRHAGGQRAEQIARARLPMGAAEALALGLADEVIAGGFEDFSDAVQQRAARLAADPGLDALIAEKARQRALDEAARPLAAYRADELARMRRNFFGFDPSYHVARHDFVRKTAKSRTPHTIARHRAPGGARQARAAS